MSTPEKKKLRVLYLSAYGELAGAETSLLDLMKQLDRTSFDPLVVVPAEGPLRQGLLDLQVDCRVLTLSPLKARNPMPYLRTVVALARLMYRERIDLVHANMDICNQYAIIPAKLLRIPIVCHTRNILSRRAFRRMFLPFSDLLIANSNATLGSYARFWPSRQRRVMIPNVIDAARLQPSRPDPRSRWNIPGDAFVALHMARIAPPKGQHVFVEALLQVARQFPKLYALIAGDTKIDDSQDYLDTLKASVRDAGLEKRILFTGFVPEAGDLLSAADVLVLTSEGEGFGRVIVEAMMMGKPVIATPNGGPAELIEDGETGWLIRPGHPDDLAKTLVRLMADPSGARAMGQRGQAWAEPRFASPQSRRAMEDVYREAVART